MEKWKEILVGLIPSNPNYRTKLEFGEENGLIVELRSENDFVKIDFSYAVAVRILDEGIQLNNLDYDEDILVRLKKDRFRNVIYEGVNGTFNNGIVKMMSEDYYQFRKLKHYILVTLNYVIDIVTCMEPKITVVPISEKQD